MADEALEAVVISGQPVPLTALEPDDFVADIIVLRRVIQIDAQGRTQDLLVIDASPSCTGMVQAGMFQVAQAYVQSGFVNEFEGDDDGN